MVTNNKPQIRFKGFSDEWEQRKLGEIGKVSMTKRVFKKHTLPKGEIPFFKIGTFGGEPDSFISRELFEEYKNKYPYPKKGDVLISASGSIGRTVVYGGEDAYFQDSNIVWFNHNGRLDNKFLEQFYSIVNWVGVEGSIIKRLYNKTILDTIINIPTLEEQQKIGTFFKTLDETISLHQQKLDSTKQFKKAMLQKMFPKKGEKIPEIRFKGFSEAWEEAKLGAYCGISRGTLPAKTSEVMGKYPFYNTGKKALQSNSYSIHTDASIIVSGHGSVGNIHFAKGRIGVSDGCYILDTNKLDIKFLYFTSKKYLSNHLNNKKTGTIISHTTKKDVESCKFYKPSLEEQEKIGFFFEGLEKTISLQENKLDIYKQFKKAMLQKMFV